MNKKLAGRLVLDLIMTVLMIIMMGYDVSGALWHEILGITTIVLFIIHIGINAGWMKQVIAKKTIQQSSVIMIKFIVDVLQIILILIISVTSVLISGFIFHVETTHYDLFAYLHNAAAYLLLITIGIHTGFHSRMIFSFLKKLFGLEQVNRVRTVVVRILAVLMVIVGVKASFDRGLAAKFIPYQSKTVQIDSTEVSQVTNELLVSDYSGTENGMIQLGAGGGHDHGDIEQNFENNPPSQDQDEDDYLGSLTCTGCGKRCSLLRPQCNTGAGQAEDAAAFYESYMTSSESQTDAAQEDTDTSSEYGSSADSSVSYVVTKDNAVSLFADYIPIMGMYAIGGHYVLLGLEAVRKRKK